MKMPSQLFTLLLLFALLNSGGAFAAKRPFTADDLINMERVSGATLSPNGNYVAYGVRTTDLESNRGRSDLWLKALDKQSPLQLTQDPASDHSAHWTSNSQSLYFLSSRSGSSQIWKLDIKSKKTVQVSDYPLDVASFKLSPQGDQIVFASRVFRDCKTDSIFKCTQLRNSKLKRQQTSGAVYDKLLVRHWDHWLDASQSQLFVAKVDAKGVITNKQPQAISGSVNGNVPSSPFGGDEEYNFSADGKSVYFSARLQNASEATSTNFDIYHVNINNPSHAINLTEKNLAWDTQPVLSHDGKTLAYLATKRPGFEADRFAVVLMDIASGKQTQLTDHWDRSFGSLTFSKDDKSLYLIGNNKGTRALWKLDIKTNKAKLVNQKGYISAVSVGTDKLITTQDNLSSPSQLFSRDLDGGKATQITFNNTHKLKKIAMGDYEQFSFQGWNDETVMGYIVKPANFNPAKKYPLAFLIHGGPQGSFGDHFHYRWNPQTYTGQGMVAVMIDFHGSTGYGQAFTDSISQNWGSRPLEDLQKGLKHALDKYQFIDADKKCALGASYGGYMINWIAGHWPDGFNCLVNHDGIFDNRMMAYATEELWFTEWEHGGPYYQAAAKHEEFNPVNAVAQWKTPMLVIQGELDYRVPVTQSLATFTALQRKGIKSRLLYFPDENHWVLKPHNSLQWHNEVHRWLGEFLPLNQD